MVLHGCPLAGMVIKLIVCSKQALSCWITNRCLYLACMLASMRSIRGPASSSISGLVPCLYCLILSSRLMKTPVSAFSFNAAVTICVELLLSQAPLTQGLQAIKQLITRILLFFL